MSATTRRAPALADRLDKADKRDAIFRAAIETFAAAATSRRRSRTWREARASPPAPSTCTSASKDDLLISIFERTMTRGDCRRT